MNDSELLVGLQAQQDEATARATELRSQIDHLTTALGETEARLAKLTTARKAFTEFAPGRGASQPAE